jgi:hypothetical protein
MTGIGTDRGYNKGKKLMKRSTWTSAMTPGPETRASSDLNEFPVSPDVLESFREEFSGAFLPIRVQNISKHILMMDYPS